MKKLILLLGAIAMTVTMANAQRGNYGHNSGAASNNGYAVNRGASTTTYRGEVRTTRSNYGRNQRYRGGSYGNNGYSRGYSNRNQRRTRYVWSDCGTFQWQVVECQRWVPARYVYRNGCRRYVDGHYGWRQVSRSRYYASCAPRRRGW